MGTPERHARVRVLFVIDVLGTSGPYRHLAHLISHLDRKRFLPVACCVIAGRDEPGELTRLGVRVLHLKKRCALDKFFRIPLEFRALLRRLQPDVVNTYLFKAGLLSLSVARLCGPRPRSPTPSRR